MKYLCLDCGHGWDSTVTATYRRCPRPDCRSRDVAPASFYRMVETARKLGINYHTPLSDLISAFQAVSKEEALLRLGFREFNRVMRRVIKEVEHPRRGRVHVE